MLNDIYVNLFYILDLNLVWIRNLLPENKRIRSGIRPVGMYLVE